MGGPFFPPGLSPMVILYSRISRVENDVVRFMFLVVFVLVTLLEVDADGDLYSKGETDGGFGAGTNADEFDWDGRFSIEVAFFNMD
jgi:hypothetical protein